MQSMCLNKIKIPLNFEVKEVNSYLIKQDPITIIDPGPYSDSFLDYLKVALKEYKLELSDIKRIVLTHGHTDHAGIAGFLQEKYYCDILIHKNDSEKIYCSLNEKVSFRKLSYGKILIQNGVPENILNFLFNYVSNFYKFSYKANDFKEIKDGDIIEFEKFSLKVYHFPGHTSGHCCFMLNNNFISGDVVLKDVFVTPLLEFDQNGKSKKNLKNLINSLNKLKNFINYKWFPAHGDNNFDKLKRIEEIESMIKSKINEIKKQLNFKLTLYENFINIYPDIPLEKFLFYISFFYGVLEILEVEKNFKKIY